MRLIRHFFCDLGTHLYATMVNGTRSWNHRKEIAPICKFHRFIVSGKVARVHDCCEQGMKIF